MPIRDIHQKQMYLLSCNGKSKSLLDLDLDQTFPSGTVFEIVPDFSLAMYFEIVSQKYTSQIKEG